MRIWSLIRLRQSSTFGIQPLIPKLATSLVLIEVTNRLKVLHLCHLGLCRPEALRPRSVNIGNCIDVID